MVSGTPRRLVGGVPGRPPGLNSAPRISTWLVLIFRRELQFVRRVWWLNSPQPRRHHQLQRRLLRAVLVRLIRRLPAIALIPIIRALRRACGRTRPIAVIRTMRTLVPAIAPTQAIVRIRTMRTLLPAEEQCRLIVRIRTMQMRWHVLQGNHFSPLQNVAEGAEGVNRPSILKGSGASSRSRSHSSGKSIDPLSTTEIVMAGRTVDGLQSYFGRCLAFG